MHAIELYQLQNCNDVPGINCGSENHPYENRAEVKCPESKTVLLLCLATITHKNCETAVVSLSNAMSMLRLMHGAEKNSMKSSKNIRLPLHSKT